MLRMDKEGSRVLIAQKIDFPKVPEISNEVIFNFIFLG